MEHQLDPRHAEVRREFNESFMRRVAAKATFWAAQKLEPKEEIKEEYDSH